MKSYKEYTLEFGVKEEKAYLIENLAMLIAYGRDITESLESIKKEIKTKTIQRVIEKVQKDVQAGLPLWQALENTKFFSYNVVTLVRIGEETGTLKDNLQIIATQEEKDRLFKSRLRSAMLYPLFVFFITMFVGVAVIWFFLPLLAQVFYELDIELPLITKIMLDISTFLNVNGYIVIPLSILIISSTIYILFFNKKTQHWGQEVMFVTPGLKKLIKEVELSRFGYTLSALLGSGLPITNALTSLQKSTLFVRYQRFYTYLLEQVQKGSTIKEVFTSYKKSYKMFPHPVQQLIFSAEQSGNLQGTAQKIGELYENKIEVTTKNTTTLMEPVLLVIVWIAVLALAVSVILPIYSLVGQLT